MKPNINSKEYTQAISVDEMRRSDKYTIDNFTSGKELMLRAANGIFKSCMWLNKKVAIVCGSGNNGGDGYALSCLLTKRGYSADIYRLWDKFSDDGRYYYDMAMEMGVKDYMFNSDTDLSSYDIIVDCIFGTGFKGTPTGVVADVINKINKTNAYVVCADINSGLDGDTGKATLAVKSDLTVSVGFYKKGMFLNDATGLIGDMVNIDIGIVLMNMTIEDIMKEIEKWCPTDHPCKSDKMVYGSIESRFKKVCVCCIATCDVIKKAMEWGADLIITHEPTYHLYGPEKELDPVNVKKKELIEFAGINILRIHDHVHFTASDKIVEGVLKKLGWDGIFDGNKKFTFSIPKSVAQIQSDIKNRLELNNLRTIGNSTQMVRNLSMCVGSWGTETVLREFSKDDIDAVMCGEICEWQVCEHARDAVQSGFEKSMFVLGHMGSERSGMEYLCEYLADRFPDADFKYIDCEEVYWN